MEELDVVGWAVEPVELVEPIALSDPVEPVLLIELELEELISPDGSVPLAAAANCVMCLRNSSSWLRTFGSIEDEALPAGAPDVPVAPVSVVLVEPLAVDADVLSVLDPSSALRSRSSAINWVFQ